VRKKMYKKMKEALKKDEDQIETEEKTLPNLAANGAESQTDEIQRR
jgi:hypothetical protein